MADEDITGIPDYLDYKLQVVFVGFNPGLTSARTGHHYASPTNRFWKLLYESGLTPVQYQPEADYKLLEHGYGLTNIVGKPSRRASDLTEADYQKGARELKKKLGEYQPEFACYTGIGVYRQFSGLRDFPRGLQEESQVPGVRDFVVSSPSGLNRTPYQEQLARYQRLKQLLENHY